MFNLWTPGSVGANQIPIHVDFVFAGRDVRAAADGPVRSILRAPDCGYPGDCGPGLDLW